MKLFTYSKAPNPQRLQLFLAWKGIALDTQEVDLRRLEQFADDFRAFNPRCIVPALQLDDGSALCDVIAIATYLEALHPARPLLGTEPLQRARILSWDQYLMEVGFSAVQDILRNASSAFKDRALSGQQPLAQIPELAERGRQRLPACWETLERQLQQTPYLVGEALTMADIDGFALIGFAGWVKATPGAEYPALQRWHQRLQAELPQHD